jgi:hypothetical protein
MINSNIFGSHHLKQQINTIMKVVGQETNDGSRPRSIVAGWETNDGGRPRLIVAG